MSSVNVSSVVPELVSWLKKEPGYETGYTYEKVNKYFPNGTDAESIALRFLIHFVGDFHQPLHCLARVNEDYPKGDAGGNAFELPYRYRVENLHALWDSVLFTTRKYLKMPLEQKNWDFLGSETEVLKSKYEIPEQD